MTIEESFENLKTLQADYRQFHDGVWQDPESYGIIAESLKVAVETVSKCQQLQAAYEARLKADMVAMLTELQLEIEETDSGCGWEGYRPTAQVIGLIQQKINDLLGKDENIGEERQNEKSN